LTRENPARYDGGVVKTKRGIKRRPVRKILLVDDVELVLKTWTRQCKRGGWTALCAQNRADALALARREKPELAVIDLFIPDDSGLDIIRDLKKLRPRPFLILVSGAMSADAAMMGVAAGADDCFDKDATMAQLVERVQSGERKPVTSLEPTMKDLQWRYIQRVLTDHGGNITQAAKTLGVFRQSLAKTISRLSPTGKAPLP